MDALGMRSPLATCQCPYQAEFGHPCGSLATQEDLLCNPCREARKTPEVVCMSVGFPDGRSIHFGLINSQLLLPRKAHD